MTAKFAVVSWISGQPKIVAEGPIALPTLRKLFLERYELRGERHHHGSDAVIRGALLAIEENFVVTVPIWAWESEDGTSRFLCQSSEDGRPPAFSIFALTEDELVKQIGETLRDPG